TKPIPVLTQAPSTSTPPSTTTSNTAKPLFPWSTPTNDTPPPVEKRHIFQAKYRGTATPSSSSSSSSSVPISPAAVLESSPEDLTGWGFSWSAHFGLF